MRHSHRPYRLELFLRWCSAAYMRHFLAPAFASIGEGLQVTGPRNVHVRGDKIHLGRFVEIHTFPGLPARLATYTHPAEGEAAPLQGEIHIGDYALLMPDLTMIAAKKITVGANCMIASGCYISDADWHGLFDRITPPGASAAIRLGDNVWIGQGCKIGKGVEIGDNSVVGAGSVVTKSLPANVIAAGAPAKPIRDLPTRRRFRRRAELFAAKDHHARQRWLLHEAHKHNGWLRWLRVCLWPTRRD